MRTSALDDSILGARIRQRRRDLGVTQTELARRIGVSPSYLNLIEWNKRRIAGALLRRIADALELTLDELDGAAERRLLATLTEVAGFPRLRRLGVEADRANELIGRFPGWARGLAALARSEQEATARTQKLSDRLTNDPVLSDAVHRMLTRIAAIRSAAEILGEHPDAPPAQRDDFLTLIRDESRSLTEVAEALAGYFGAGDDMDRNLTPVDEVEALFEAPGPGLADLETAAAALADAVPAGGAADRAAAARAVAEDALGDAISALAERDPNIVTAAGRRRARSALLEFAADALLLPADAFVRRAAELGYDAAALADAFGVRFPVVCRRLATAPAGGAGPRFGYLQANAAGTITRLVGQGDLAIPRYAPVCPLWALFRAQQAPGAVARQVALFPSNRRYVFLARASKSGPERFGAPVHYVTDMLILAEEEARRTVYATAPAEPGEEVGPGCRLCPRQACPHRVDDPLTG